MEQLREYLRCPDCLGVWSVEPDLQKGAGALVEETSRWPDAVTVLSTPGGRRQARHRAMQEFLEGGCPWCEADVTPEQMGHVKNDEGRLEVTELVPECDGRCTHAVGPLCVCKCGCKNHGLGYLAYVERSKTTGKLRTRFNAAPKNMDKARERAVEWYRLRERLETLEASIDASIAGWITKQREVRWLKSEDYQALAQARARKARLRRVYELRVHHKRVSNALALFAEPVQQPAAEPIAEVKESSVMFKEDGGVA